MAAVVASSGNTSVTSTIANYFGHLSGMLVCVCNTLQNSRDACNLKQGFTLLILQKSLVHFWPQPIKELLQGQCRIKETPHISRNTDIGLLQEI